MRILKRDFPIGGSGFIYLIPDDDEDLFYIYNLIIEGDAIRAKTFRKVVHETKTGSVSQERKLLSLTLKVVSIDYTEGGENVQLQIKGKNMQENEFLSVGQFHTMKIELGQPLSITKNIWEKYHVDLIKESSNIAETADAAAFIMDEGVGHLCYIKNNSTVIKSKIEKNVPKKKSGGDMHDKALASFFEACFQSLLTLNFNKVKAVIIASPGFVAPNFLDFIKKMADKEEYVNVKMSLDKFMVVKASNGYKDALTEVLADPAVMNRLKDTKAIKEIKALEAFFNIMKKDLDRIAYGTKHVIEANSHKAIDTLLLSDNLFRSKNFAKRKIFNDLADKVKEYGGEVFIFSSMHASGEKLNNLTGIAAILRFPLNMDYLDDEEEEEKEKEISEEEKRKEDLKLEKLIQEKDINFDEGF